MYACMHPGQLMLAKYSAWLENCIVCYVHIGPYIALQQTRQDSVPQVKLGKTLNLQLFGVGLLQTKKGRC